MRIQITYTSIEERVAQAIASNATEDLEVLGEIAALYPDTIFFRLDHPGTPRERLVEYNAKEMLIATGDARIEVRPVL